MNSYDERPESDAINDMLADLELDPASEAELRSVLTDVRAQAARVPVASADVVALLKGAVPLRRSHHRLAIAAAAGALALGGASAAAATNQLPDPLQEVVANVTENLPVSAPHPKPVKPTNAPTDAPGQLKDKTHGNDGTPGPSDGPTDHNSDAPGQIQKATKPDPSLPGPAKPADPGSHGRARAADVQADHTKGGNKKDKDTSSDHGSGKPATDKKPKKSHPSFPADLPADDHGGNGQGGHGHNHG